PWYARGSLPFRSGRRWSKACRSKRSRIHAACKMPLPGRTVSTSSGSENHDIRPKAPTRRSGFTLRDRRVTNGAGFDCRKFSREHLAAVATLNPASAPFLSGAAPDLIPARPSHRLGDFGGQGFGQTFAALLTLSAVFCIVVGTMRREAIFGHTLTHWDEAA